MDRAPARLKLHPSPAAAVGTAVRVLSEWIPVERLRLGGGTALEARWRHRSSTDLDFVFCPGDVISAYRDLETGARQPPSALERPKYDLVANNLWLQVLRLFESDLKYVPPLRCSNGDADHGREGHGR